MMIRFENNAFSSIVHAGDMGAAVTNLFRAVVQLPEKAIGEMYKWQTRLKDRQAISEMTDAQLKDIGITRESAMTEARKPFYIP